MMLIIVAYDIQDNKKRTRLHKLLKGYGMPVQYSVFECHLNQKQFKKLQSETSVYLGEENDSIVYYCLCESCQKKTTAFYKQAPLSGLSIVV